MGTEYIAWLFRKPIMDHSIPLGFKPDIPVNKYAYQEKGHRAKLYIIFLIVGQSLV